MKFYDAHMHQVGNATGGFLIALEGKPKFEWAMTNEEIFSYENISKHLYAVEYVTKKFQTTRSEIVKYHPRREQYNKSDVSADIKKRMPKIVIVDTLNQPYWTPSDYWYLAIDNPNVQFIFAHSGGYDILEFIKMVHFQKNIWIDFSFTLEYFGCCSNKNELGIVCNSIKYALNHKVISKKILFGSDFPINNQNLQKDFFDNYDTNKFLVENFLQLVSILNKDKL